MNIKDNYFSIGTLPDDCTHQDVIKRVYKTFKEDFRATYDYIKSPVKKYTGDPLHKDLRKSLEYQAYALYCYTIGNWILDNGDINLSDSIANEIKYYEFEKGGSCIYNAALFINLLVDSGLVPPNNIKLIQGYYRHELREDFPSFIPFGKNHYGMHCWTLIKKSVIDFCIIPQEEKFFDFKDKIFLDGVVPDGLNYYGYEESFEVAKEYCKDFAKYSKLDYREWILNHRLKAMEYSQFKLEELMRDIDKN